MSDSSQKGKSGEDSGKWKQEKAFKSTVKKNNIYLLSNTLVNDTPFAMAKELKEKAKGLNQSEIQISSGPTRNILSSA